MGCNDYVTTVSGNKFFFFGPDLNSVSIEDIAFHLSGIRRFCGGLNSDYSVAEHSVLVSLNVSGGFEVKLAALLHDAVEAYTGDIPSPLKRNLLIRTEDGALVSFGEFESLLLRVVWGKFIKSGIDDLWVEEIKRVDELVLGLECNYFEIFDNFWRNIQFQLLDYDRIEGLSRDRARKLFLTRFYFLEERISIQAKMGVTNV